METTKAAAFLREHARLNETMRQAVYCVPNISTCPNECGLLDAPRSHPPDPTLSRVCPLCGFAVAVVELIVRAGDLQRGDYLPATKQTILASERGARTPSGKSEIVFRRDNGLEGRTLWGSTTRIRIVRASDGSIAPPCPTTPPQT